MKVLSFLLFSFYLSFADMDFEEQDVNAWAVNIHLTKQISKDIFIAHYKKAIYENNTSSAYFLAEEFYNGENVEVDLEEALRWYELVIINEKCRDN